jgi:hypothetical protein
MAPAHSGPEDYGESADMLEALDGLIARFGGLESM